MFILDMIRADKYNSRADSINIKAFNKLAKTQELQREKQIKTSQSIIKLANRKKGIISTSINDFINLYERIMKVNFTETDGIREVYKLNNSVEVIDEMKLMISTAAQVLTEKDAVNTFLVGFFKFGGLVGGVSNIISKEAELNECAARMRKKQISVIESQIETINTSLEVIYERAERISVILAKINILFRKSIEVTSITNTEIIKITVSDTDKKLAAKIANETAEVFSKEIPELYSISNVNILDTAEEASSPSNISVMKQSAIFLIAGLVLGCAIVFVIYYFDRTVKTTEQVELKIGLPILGTIQDIKKGRK